jgi:hypothetical protein
MINVRVAFAVFEEGERAGRSYQLHSRFPPAAGSALHGRRLCAPPRSSPLMPAAVL